MLLGFSTACAAETTAPVIIPDSVPIFLQEGLSICFSHFDDSEYGETYAREKAWDIAVEQEYPKVLRTDKLMTKTFDDRKYLVGPNIEKFGAISKSKCTIYAYPVSGPRTLPAEAFASVNDFDGMVGKLETFKACEDCLDDLAGQWVLTRGTQTVLIRAMSGARNDFTINFELD